MPVVEDEKIRVTSRKRVAPGGCELQPNSGLRLATCSDRRDIVLRLVRRALWAQPCQLSVCPTAA